MSVKIWKNGQLVKVDGGVGAGGEPDEYLKSINKNETDKKITVTDKNGVQTEFPYGNEPSEYLVNAEVVDTNTLKINPKEGNAILFSPTITGGVTKEYVDQQDASLSSSIGNEQLRAKEAEGALQTTIYSVADTKLNVYDKVPGTTEDYHVPYNITNLRYDTSDHKLKGTLETVTLNNSKAHNTYELEIELPNIENKLDIIANESGIYAQYDDGETRETKILPYSEDVEEGALVQRNANGAVFVRATPTEDNEAISKGYLESHAGASALINDTTPSTTTAYSGTKTQNLVNALTGQVDVEVVTIQPASPADKTIYFIGTGPNYTIKMYNDNNWYDMGTSTIDFSNYYTKAQVDGKVANNLTTTAAGYVLDARQGKVVNDSLSELSATVSDLKVKKVPEVESKANAAYNGLTNGSVTKVGTATKGNALQGIYLNGGTPTAGTQLYNKNININGSNKSVIRSDNSDIGTIYAPTGAGTSGQVLKSTGGTPGWTNWVIDTLMIANTTEKKTSGNYIFDKNITDYKFIMFELINEYNEVSHEFLYTTWVDTKGNNKYILNKSTAGTDRYVLVRFDAANVCYIISSRNLGIKAVLGVR